MTKGFLQFDPLFNLTWLMLVLFAVSILIIVLDLKKSRRFLFYRMLAIIIAMFSVAMLFLRPAYLNQNSSDQYLILTAHYSEQAVDSLLKIHPKLEILTYGDSSKRATARPIQTRQQLKDLDGKIVYITGEGLSTSHLRLLEEKTFGFLPAAKPSGIVSISLPENATVGQWSIIKGNINIQEPTTLQLIDPSGKKDSVIFKKAGEQAFTFKIHHKQPGQILYKVKTTTTQHEETYTLPLKVKDFEKLEVLMLQLAPSFEMRQLKNFLADQGHGIQVRSQLSKSNFSYEKVNTTLNQISFLTDGVLKNYDLLIVENSTLEQLSKNELEAMGKATNAGLGILLLMDQPKNKNSLAQIFIDFNLKKDDKDTVHLSLDGSAKKHILKKLNLNIPTQPDILPLLKHGDNVLAAYRHEGFGKITLQLLNETYSLRLAGDSVAYAGLWSNIISASSRTEMKSTEITLADDFPYFAGLPLCVNIITTEDKPLLYYEGQIIPLTENVLIDQYWSATLRPQKAGWNTIHLNDSTPFTFFVAEPHEWSALRRQQQINLHQTEALNQTKADDVRIAQYKTIPRYYFYLTFLLAMGFLWLAPKL
ncbi:MAG: hypothetical protein EBR30_02150 [Cytophagia bacterium]|nr:hypothetical protein [Cytophagia bacterium]